MVIPVFYRLKISPVLGFMLIGLLVGPYGVWALLGRPDWLQAVIIAADDTSSNLPSADLIKRFLPGVKEFKSPLAGRTALFANARIKQLLGWKQEHFFPF